MNNENLITENEMSCPIYFENHIYPGHLYSIENFTNINFGDIRTTIINGRPYFSAIDLCRGLLIDPKHISQMVIEASQDIINSYYNDTPHTRSGGYQNSEKSIVNTPLARYGGYQNSEKIIVKAPHTRSGEPQNSEKSIVEAPLARYGGPVGNDLYYYLDIEISNTNQYGTSFSQVVKTIFVSESMMYMFMFKSRKREAVRFKAWLATEILPNMRLLGAQKSVQLLNQEANTIADELANINNQYSNIESNTAKILEKQDMDTKLIKYEMNDIKARLDAIGNLTGVLAADDCILNDKVTAIASGLNTIFG